MNTRVGYGDYWTKESLGRREGKEVEERGICFVSYIHLNPDIRYDFPSLIHLTNFFATAKSAKQRRIAARVARRSASTSTPESQAPPVPLHEQSIDLPSAPQNRFGRDVDVQAGVRAQEAREELTASMREKRRKSIKEANFLRGMR